MSMTVQLNTLYIATKKRLQHSYIATAKDTITLQYVNVQHQYGGSDCGLYALAFAAALCAGIDPTACIILYLQPGTDERTLPDLHHKGTDRSISSQAIT